MAELIPIDLTCSACGGDQFRFDGDQEDPVIYCGKCDAEIGRRSYVERNARAEIARRLGLPPDAWGGSDH